MSSTYAIVATTDISLAQPNGTSRSFKADEVVNLIMWDGRGKFDPGARMKLVEVPAGWGVVNSKLVPLSGPGSTPSTTLPVPASITRRQLLIGLAAKGLITPEEALAAAKDGAVPAAMEAIFATLSPSDAFGARVTWASMTQADRDNPLVAALGASKALSAADLDDLYRFCATL